jgi:hypothetical protein
MRDRLIDRCLYPAAGAEDVSRRPLSLDDIYRRDVRGDVGTSTGGISGGMSGGCLLETAVSTSVGAEVAADVNEEEVVLLAPCVYACSKHR